MGQRIRIGPMSGRSNVVHWLRSHDVEPTEELVGRIFDAAKQSDRLLEDAELTALVNAGAATRVL